jgi:hypothetical protein
MKPQEPAQGIMQTGNWGDTKSYKVVCDCGQPDHEHNVFVESEHGYINVTIYVNVKSKFWSVNRFKQIWTLLTKGYLEHETVVTMNEQEALNYAETLRSAIQDVKTFKKS